MLRFLSRLGAFLVIQIVVGGIVILYGRPGNSKHYLSAIEDKVERLESCQGPKIVIIGGSNVAFGIHSPVMQETLGMETVNLGLNLALGLPFQLECYLEHARHDDIVILSPEYQLLTSVEQQQGNRLIIDYLLLQYPKAKKYIDPSGNDDWKQFLDRDGLWTVHQWVGRAFKKMRDEDTTDQIYCRSSFNECGDVVAHYGQTTKQPISVGPVPPLTKESVEQTVSLLNRFHQECQQRGVSVYFSYSPILDTDYKDAQDSIDQLHHILGERVTIPLLHDPSKFAHASDRFYDTGYHLNQEAGEARTRYLANAIQKAHFLGSWMIATNQNE